MKKFETTQREEFLKSTLHFWDENQKIGPSLLRVLKKSQNVPQAEKD